MAARSFAFCGGEDALADTADLVIIGGAAIGSSVAAQLAARNDFSGRIVVVEAEPAYTFCASARSAASIRQQFSSAINIEISLFGIAFLRDIGLRLATPGGGQAPDIGLKEGGYLFLATPETRPILEENHALQRQLGADIAFYEPCDLQRRFPFLNIEGIAAGCHGTTGEGWFDGYGLMQAFRARARALGVEYVAARVIGLERGEAAWRVRLDTGVVIEAGAVLNAAGASGGAEICRLAGLQLPIHRRKRFVFPFTCREKVTGVPLLIDPDGTYVRPEGEGFICGAGPDDDPDVAADDFEVDHAFFDERLWPSLANRVPAFEAIRPGAAWAGHYDMNLFDHNAFVGSVPGRPGLYIALGFSGHGLQQSPAVGRGLAELIATGGYETLDLAPLGLERLAQGKPLIERNVV